MKMKKHTPSEAELEILNVLWKKGQATVREVHEQLSQIKAVGYTTTLKQMQRMLEKEMIRREDSGKTHLYSAVAEEAVVKNTLLDRLMNSAFGGSAMKMVMHALGQSEATPEEIEKLESFLKDQKNKDNE
jgi:predicted transcriptional regulator